VLTKLSLTNFKKHTELELEFTPGLNLIVGDNWSGKTTVLTAILYALYGSSVINHTAANLPTKGTKSFKIELDFYLDGEYKITRTNKDAYLYKDGVTVASATTAVNKAVSEIFGLDAAAFKTFYHMPAKGGDALLDLSYEKLGNILDSVTGVTTVGDIINLATSSQQHYSSASDKLQVVLRTYQEYKAHVDSAQEKISQLDERFGVLTTELEEKEKLLNETRTASTAKAVATAINEKTQQLQAREQALEIISTHAKEIERLKQEIEQTGYISHDLYAQLEEEHKEGAAKLELINEVRLQIEDLQQRQLSSRGQLAQISSRLRELEDVDLSYGLEVSLDDEFEACAKAYESAKHRLASAQVAAKSTSCPTCKRAYDASTHNNAQAELLKATTAHENAHRKYKEISDRYNSFRLHKEEIANFKKSYNDWDTYINNCQALMEQQKQVLLDNYCNALEHAELGERIKYEKERLEDKKERESEITYRSKELATAEEKLNALPEVSKEEIASLKKEKEKEEARLSKAKEDYDTVYLAYNQVKGELDQLRNSVEPFEARLPMLSREVEELKEEAEHYETIKSLIKYLKEAKIRYSKEAWNNILAYANLFLARTSSGDLRAIEIEDGALCYREGGGTQLPVSEASALQRVLLALSLQLALGAALRGAEAPLMLLDEVTGPATDDNAMLLAQELQSQGGQIILVSHREVAADNIIHLH